jgi:hypothetical protein
MRQQTLLTTEVLCTAYAVVVNRFQWGHWHLAGDTTRSYGGHNVYNYF